MATLTLIRGLPGAGKSTYAKQHFDCLILENDMWHVEDGCYKWTKDKLQAALKWVYKTAELMLENGKDVCIANTFTRKAFVNSYKLLTEKHGARFNVIRLETQFKSVHAVPDEVAKSMKDSFEDWPGEVIISRHKEVY